MQLGLVSAITAEDAVLITGIDFSLSEDALNVLYLDWIEIVQMARCLLKTES